MAKVTAPQATPATAQKVMNDAADAMLAFGLEVHKQFLVAMAGGTPVWTTADTLYTSLKA